MLAWRSGMSATRTTVTASFSSSGVASVETAGSVAMTASLGIPLQPAIPAARPAAPRRRAWRLEMEGIPRR
jgi:hypothetical protein